MLGFLIGVVIYFITGMIPAFIGWWFMRREGYWGGVGAVIGFLFHVFGLVCLLLFVIADELLRYGEFRTPSRY